MRRFLYSKLQLGCIDALSRLLSLDTKGGWLVKYDCRLAKLKVFPGRWE